MRRILVIGAEQTPETLTVLTEDVDHDVMLKAPQFLRLGILLRFDEFVVVEGRPVGVRHSETLLAVRRVAVQARLRRPLRGLALAQLTWYVVFSAHLHFFLWRHWWKSRLQRLPEVLNDVLKGDDPRKVLDAATDKGVVPTDRATDKAVVKEAVSTRGTAQHVGAGENDRPREQLQTDWTLEFSS